MDKFPVYRAGAAVGEMRVREGAGETRFSVVCPAEGVWGVWAEGDRGEVRLATVRARGVLRLERTFSRRFLAPLGALCRAELRGASPVWVPPPEDAFRDPRLRAVSRSTLWREREGRRYLAFEARTDRPFPLPALFCFASLRRIDGRAYWVFSFDARERPCFWS